MNKRCLRTGIELKEMDLGGVPFHFSEKSGGIWLDNFIYPKLKRTSDAIKESLAELMLAPEAGTFDLEERTKNPSGKMVMIRKPISFCSRLTVDQCPETGGVWIDRQDRSNLLEIFQHSEYMGRKENAGLYIGSRQTLA